MSAKNDNKVRPLVSVVIPCFNQGHYLPDAIKSVQSQLVKPVQITVVNDGSTDDTEKVSRRADCVQYIRQANSGLAKARNVGLQASEGVYIVFLDADDRLLSGSLQSQVEFLERRPECAFVYGHVRLIGSDGSVLSTPKQTCVEKDHYLTLLATNFIWTPGACMYRREIVLALGGFNEKFPAASDLDINMRISRKYPIGCVAREVLEYRVHETNMSGNPEVNLRDSVLALRAQVQWVEGNELHMAALRKGLAAVRSDYGNKLATEIVRRVRVGKIWQAIRGAMILFLFDPTGLGRCVRAGLGHFRQYIHRWTD
jgi:glycosyltransferase involved in cell wall biosynthesis